ncbi:MAG: amidophosphoribosyltransferase [Gammaproteobacteria bacterium]|nr:amidophosphoribosyltransferase [Gammaproteobacteria bacterium]
MCGIVGIVGRKPVNQLLYDSLTLLQHRGQDAAGIVTCDANKFYLRKNNGLVSDVFQAEHMLQLMGNMGIGHVRYPTAGCSSSAEAQPFYVNSPYGIAMAHNGNLTNAEELKSQLYRDDLRHINTDSDSEVLLNIFAHELQQIKKLDVTADEIFTAVEQVHKRCRGGYAVVATIVGKGILAFRDPFGIRPIVYGKRTTELGVEYMIASESVALHALGFELMRDLVPGEAIFIDVDGNFHSQQCAENPQYSPCIFEYVYFARPDSIIDNVSVYKARLRMGSNLVAKLLRIRPDHDIDVVIPIPDTSRTSALEMAYHLGVKYREGFIKNRYIGRTFIMPGQKQRKKSVRQKLNAIDLEFKGKNVLLVDDSIVRGTTSKQIIQMAREAGANKVYMASAAPPVRYPNVYGIDMPSPKEFIADNRTEEEIAKEIGADWLIYQDLDDLIEAVQKGNKSIKTFDCSCFDNKYITNDIDDAYFQHLDTLRSDSAKQQREQGDKLSGIDLYSSQ